LFSPTVDAGDVYANKLNVHDVPALSRIVLFLKARQVARIFNDATDRIFGYDFCLTSPGTIPIKRSSHCGRPPRVSRKMP